MKDFMVGTQKVAPGLCPGLVVSVMPLVTDFVV